MSTMDWDTHAEVELALPSYPSSAYRMNSIELYENWNISARLRH